MPVHSFFERLLSVTYIKSVTHGAFYFVDYTFIPEFTFVDTFSVDLDGREQLHSLSIKCLENIPRLIFVVRFPLSNSDKLLNI